MEKEHCLFEHFKDRLEKGLDSTALAGLIGVLESLTAGDKPEEFIMEMLKGYVGTYNEVKGDK